jgi:hypothetical protein
MSFLNHFIGRYSIMYIVDRGLFNLFLATVVINDVSISFNEDNKTSAFEVITYIVASFLVVIGFIFIGLYCWKIGNSGKNYLLKP